MKTRLRYLIGALTCAAALNAGAQSYPQRPVRVIVPYPPGGTVDAVARVFADALSEQLGQTFVVENRAGASGSIGSEAVARAAADGYTLLVNASTFAASPLLLKNLPYDIDKDFTPITNLGEVPLLVTANPSVPAQNLSEFITLARKQPGKYFFGASAAGSASHLAEAAISYEAKAQIPIVLYKGTAPALTDLMGGHISAVIDAVPSSLPPVQAGRTKALAVTSAQRLGTLPDVPTVSESGLPGFEMVSWYGLWGPAKLPVDIVGKLHEAVRKAVDSPRVKRLMSEQAFVGKATEPADFAAYVRAEHAKYARLIKAAGITIE